MTNENPILIQAAKEASEGSFPCMSGFKVGAALLIQNTNGHHEIIKGANYETQNYRSVCAEKHALQSAHLHCPEASLIKMAIYSPQSAEPIFPCGDCRQALYEANPELKIVCAAANGEYKEFSIAELLPYGFRLQKPSKLKNSLNDIQKQICNYIVHFPVLEDKLNMLENIKGLIVVGSPIRALKLAEHFQKNLSLKVCTYCHIGSGSDREYSLFVVEENNLKIGIASHGIGASGIEIILAEIMALNALSNYQNNHKPSIKAVIRSGTRGTIADIPLGSIALTTQAYNEHNYNFPDAKLTESIKKVAPNIISPSDETYLGTPSGVAHLFPPSGVAYLFEPSGVAYLFEGACLSAQFFWTGQGRTPYPLLGQIEEKDNENYLREWQQKGIKWVEMEDYYLNHFAHKFGIASAALGLVVAKRYEAKTDRFVLSYDADTKKDKELMPAEIAYKALQEYFI